MANQEQPPRASFPPQPYQLIGPNHSFTPYYIKPSEAGRFPGQATPYLSSGLHHPAQHFPRPRNQYPGSDAIMDARKGVCKFPSSSSSSFCTTYCCCCSRADECMCVQDGEKAGVLSYEQVAALKDVKEMSVVERHARDVCGF